MSSFILADFSIGLLNLLLENLFFIMWTFFIANLVSASRFMSNLVLITFYSTKYYFLLHGLSCLLIFSSSFPFASSSSSYVSSAFICTLWEVEVSPVWEILLWVKSYQLLSLVLVVLSLVSIVCGHLAPSPHVYSCLKVTPLIDLSGSSFYGCL